MRTPSRVGKVAEIAKRGKEKRDKETKHAATKQKDRFRLWQTQLLASSPSSCSAILLFSRAVNKKTVQRLLFLLGRNKNQQNEQLPKHPAFNVTNTGQYIGRKHIFED